MTPRIPVLLRVALIALAVVNFAGRTSAADATRKPFNVPAGAAPSTLKVFSAQAGGHLLYSAEAVDGVMTNTVRGEFAPADALDLMLDGTRLIARRDGATGALSVTRRAETSRLDTGMANSRAGSNGEAAAIPGKEVVELSVFTVNSDRDRGFVAASALAGGRLSTDLKDTPVAYSVLTRDFIEALNITNLTMAQQWTTGFTRD